MKAFGSLILAFSILKSDDFRVRMREELLNKSLLFGLNYVRNTIAERADDHNHFRPPVAPTPPFGLCKTAEALATAG